MRYRIFSTVTAAAALLLLSVLRAGAQEIVSAGVSRDTILIGDQIEWTSEMRLPRGMSVRIDSMSGYVVPGVELIGQRQLRPASACGLRLPRRGCGGHPPSPGGSSGSDHHTH